MWLRIGSVPRRDSIVSNIRKLVLTRGILRINGLRRNRDGRRRAGDSGFVGGNQVSRKGQRSSVGGQEP